MALQRLLQFASTLQRLVYLCHMRILAIALIMSVGLNASAQVTDTLGWQRFHEGTPTVYSSPNGGFAFGNNGYGDKVKAQSYSHSESHVLRGALIRFGNVTYTSTNPESRIRVTVYANNGRGLGLYGFVDDLAPDSVLAVKDVPLSALPSDDSPFFVDLSDSNLVFFNRFSIGVDLTLLAAGDTVGLLSTADGDGGERQESWEQDASDDWMVVVSPFSWGLDVDFAIFPLVDVNDPAGISGPTLDVSMWPNPSSGPVRITAPYAAPWMLTVHNASGQLVAHGHFQSDRHDVDLSHLSTGLHIVRIQHGQNMVSKRLIIQ